MFGKRQYIVGIRVERPIAETVIPGFRPVDRPTVASSPPPTIDWSTAGLSITDFFGGVQANLNNIVPIVVGVGGFMVALRWAPKMFRALTRAR
jgi:hypothetical protein